MVSITNRPEACHHQGIYLSILISYNAMEERAKAVVTNFTLWFWWFYWIAMTIHSSVASITILIAVIKSEKTGKMKGRIVKPNFSSITQFKTTRNAHDLFYRSLSLSWLVVLLKSRGDSWTKCHREHCNAIFKIWT